jgi:hypothetical protein
MRTATSFDDLESAWIDLLSRLEKVWEKLEQVCRPQNSKFPPWHGRQAAFRRKDMLLRYVHQARNADHHTLAESVGIQPGEYSFKVPAGKPGQVVHIKSLKTDSSGKVVHYEGNVAPEVVDRPARVVLLPVKNRGQTYNPPTQHLGLMLKATDPVTVATLGLTFYEEMVKEAETAFFPPTI